MVCVNSRVLLCRPQGVSQVIDYCKYHKDSPAEEIQKPLKSTQLPECGVSEWDNDFVNVEQEVYSCSVVVAMEVFFGGATHLGRWEKHCFI